MSRRYRNSDKILIALDQGLRTLYGSPESSGRASPAANTTEGIDTKQAKRQAAALMRVNHAGEVAAQALYFGQAITAQNRSTYSSLLNAAQEEGDHLIWCAERLQQLHSHTSYLGPIWYLGSMSIGALAGLRGDAFSLGFVAETEYQVSAHLSQHLQRLPTEDTRSRQILLTMREDEEKHATHALESGGRRLPWLLRQSMRLSAKVMTSLAYRL
jgi:3-demethoxyubiquinol 3-hydroxylase